MSDDSSLSPRAADALLAEAIRRAAEAVDSAEGAVAGLGQWLFSTLFYGDTKAVLDRTIEQPQYLALLDAAESARLPIGRTTIRNALRVAAYDKRLSDEPWSRLRYSSKLELLSLEDPKLMRAAARHVLAASLNLAQTRAYVIAVLNPEGRVRKISPRLAQREIERLLERVGDARTADKIANNLKKLDERERAKSLSRLALLIERLQRVKDALAEESPGE